MDTRAAVLRPAHWDEQYQEDEVLPWETGRPSSELRRVLREYDQKPDTALELGCGTGVNALWLARRGYDVTAVDLSPSAIRIAQGRAEASGVGVRFLAGDLRDADRLGGPFGFFFDRGCYHAVRLADRDGYHRTLDRVLRPGAVGLVLTGNAAEPEDESGPPVVTEATLRAEWAPRYAILHLRPFRFDASRAGDKRYLGWSLLVRRGEAR